MLKSDPLEDSEENNNWYGLEEGTSVSTDYENTKKKRVKKKNPE